MYLMMHHSRDDVTLLLGVLALESPTDLRASRLTNKHGPDLVALPCLSVDVLSACGEEDVKRL